MAKTDFSLRPIPKYILDKIQVLDKERCPDQKGPTRFYSYLATVKGELTKITVGVKFFHKQWHCKQVAAHGVKSDKCYVRDMEYCSIGYGYRVGWQAQGYKHGAWYEDGHWYDAGFKYYNPFTRPINREYIGKFPQFKYSAYELFNGDCIITYLRTYLKYPQTEYLLKLGLCRLHNKKTILKRIATDKQFCKWLIAHKNEITDCYAGAILHAYRSGRPIKQVQRMQEFKKTFKNNSDVPMLQEWFGESLDKFYAYIADQDTDPLSYLDYVKACEYLRINMSRRDNRTPNNFQRWHDRRIDEYNDSKMRADEKQRAEIYEQFARVAEKYLALQNCKKGMYAVQIARSPAELIHEGEQLKHCVGRMDYEKKMAREETLVFFIRAVNQLDIPFVTVEYSLESKKVLQCYGHQSKKPDETVLTFVNKVWLPYANRTIKKLCA